MMAERQLAPGNDPRFGPVYQRTISVAHIELSHRLVALHIYDCCNLLSLRQDEDVIDIATGCLQHLLDISISIAVTVRRRMAMMKFKLINSPQRYSYWIYS